MNVALITISVLILPLVLTIIVIQIVPNEIDANIYSIIYSVSLFWVSCVFLKTKISSLKVKAVFKVKLIPTILAVFSIALVDHICVYIFGGFPKNNDYENIYLLFIGTVIAAPIAEEVAFRKLLLTLYIRKLPKQLSITICSLIWAFAHLSFEANIIFSVFFAGIILSILYLESGLPSAIAVHCIVNFAYFVSVISEY